MYTMLDCHKIWFSLISWQPSEDIIENSRKWRTLPYPLQSGNLVHAIGIKLHKACISSENEDVQPEWKQHGVVKSFAEHTPLEILMFAHEMLSLPNVPQEFKYLVRFFFTVKDRKTCSAGTKKLSKHTLNNCWNSLKCFPTWKSLKSCYSWGEKEKGKH